MAAIWRHALARNWGQILGWGLSLRLLAAYLMSFYDTLVDQQATLKQLMASYPPELLAVLRRIEARGAHETAHRTKEKCGQVFRYAIATGRASRDPSADLRGALAPIVRTSRAAVTDPAKVGDLLRALDGYSGQFVTRCALRLAPLLFVRPGELVEPGRLRAELRFQPMDGVLGRV